MAAGRCHPDGLRVRTLAARAPPAELSAGRRQQGQADESRDQDEVVVIADHVGQPARGPAPLRQPAIIVIRVGVGAAQGQVP